MKVVMNALVTTALLGSIALADDMDEQIQKLEKETKLLELKKENEQLKNDTQIVNQNTTQENNPSTSKPKKKKSVKPYTKNGVFIGVEGVLGGASEKFEISGVTTYADASAPDYGTPFSERDSRTTFDLGLVGGYQHYFGSSQKHGIKVSAHIYSGFGNDWKMNHDEEPYVFDDTKFTDTDLRNDSVTISYVPIKVGFDVKYLWDFLERGKHVLGLNVGVGYEFDAYVGGKEKTLITSDETNTDKTTSVTHASHDEYEENYKANSIYSNEIYPVIGLHYYYGHHQFELMYRFGGIISWETKKDVAHDNFDEEAGSKVDSTKNVDVNVDIAHKLTLTTQSYLAINYTYRF